MLKIQTFLIEQVFKKRIKRFPCDEIEGSDLALDTKLFSYLGYFILSQKFKETKQTHQLYPKSRELDAFEQKKAMSQP